ncbi:hypothetical protein [Chryseobacterium sp.]|uniref:hypothetical protein n=1 Tax=Chryseobacterium sp. TaxID=1871047 RepID=UPI0032190875
MARPKTADQPKIEDFFDKPISQTGFAELLGLSRMRITQYVAEGTLPRAGSFRQWIGATLDRARKNGGGKPIAPRAAPAGSDDPDEIDPNREKALLAREQRRGHEIKNRVAEGKYAEIGLLADVLAEASAAVVAQFDQLEGRLAKECPDLPEEAKRVTLQMLARARNLWIDETATLVKRRVEAMTEGDDDE